MVDVITDENEVDQAVVNFWDGATATSSKISFRIFTRRKTI